MPAEGRGRAEQLVRREQHGCTRGRQNRVHQTRPDWSHERERRLDSPTSSSTWTRSYCGWRSDHCVSGRRQAWDGQSYEEYAANVDQNLNDLHARLKSGRYQAPVIRRVRIPKANGKLRALGITTIEDRVVQKAVAWVLSAVFEQDFLDSSHGFRPNRSPHTALHRLRDGMMQH